MIEIASEVYTFNINENKKVPITTGTLFIHNEMCAYFLSPNKRSMNKKIFIKSKYKSIAPQMTSLFDSSDPYSTPAPISFNFCTSYADKPVNTNTPTQLIIYPIVPLCKKKKFIRLAKNIPTAPIIIIDPNLVKSVLVV